MELNCPSCHSENTQKLSAVYESGLSNIAAQTHGVGIGLGRRGLSVGAGAASTSGTSQTVVSQRAAPPQKKGFLKPLLKILGVSVVAALVVSSLHIPFLGIVVDLAWFAGSGAWVYHALRYNATTWVMLTEEWQKSFLCHRCNHVFLPTRG